MGRAYPAQKKRLSIIETLKAKPENERSSDEWWMLGEFQIFEGVMDENDFLVNDGVLALQSGVDLANPSPACLLDLGWILMFKNMDAMALPYLRKATELVPASRDAWAFRALSEIGCNDRDAAIKSLTKAIGLPGATENDRNTLEEAKSDKSLKEIRKEALLRKIEPEDNLIRDVNYETDEKIKWCIHVLKGHLELEPENVQYQMLLAEGRYRLNQFEQSEKLLLSLIASQGDKAKAYTLLALIAKKHRKDRDTELNYYQKALECDPDYLLALVNLASAYQDDEEWYLARPLLERACQGDNTSAYFPLALDLYGSNIGVIEKNFKKEIAFHEAAIQLDSNNPVFFANLICSLLCDDRADEAKVYFHQQKNKLSSLSPFYDLIAPLMRLLSKSWGHPSEFFDEKVLDVIKASLSPKAAHPLLRRAWSNRQLLLRQLSQKKRFDPKFSNREILESFYQDMGIYATQFEMKDEEISEIWSEAELKTGNKKFAQNHAVHMSRCGRHAEALELIDSLEPVEGDRFYTILGNTRMNAHQFLSAVDAYKLALSKDKQFLLPIRSAIDCLDTIKRPDLLNPFITKLEEEWAENVEAIEIKANALALQGFPKKSAKLFNEILIEKDSILDPEEFHERHGQKDMTLLGKPDIQYHKTWAEMLVLAGQFGEFERLYQQVESWPRWSDGDWMVLRAEAARRQGNIEKAIEISKEMPKEPPPQVTLALCALEENNFQEAEKIAQEILEDPRGAKNFNHIEGRPDAVAKSIVALELLNRGQLGEAKELAITSIRDDVGSAICRTTYANIMLLLNDSKEAIRSLKEGLKRRPGNPAMLRILVETLVNIKEFETAAKILGENRVSASSHGVPGLVERLGELIAIEKLALFEIEIDLNNLNIPWSNDLSDLSKTWLKALFEIDKRKINLVEAKMLYASKIAEKELAERIFVPFRDSLERPEKYGAQDYSDFSRFLAGDFAPSIGGMHRILLAAKNDAGKNDPPLLIKFRQFISGHSAIRIQPFNTGSFLRKLNSLAHARNAVAHVGEPNSEKWSKYQEFVLTDTSPGPLLQALGFDD